MAPQKINRKSLEEDIRKIPQERQKKLMDLGEAVQTSYRAIIRLHKEDNFTRGDWDAHQTKISKIKQEPDYQRAREKLDTYAKHPAFDERTRHLAQGTIDDLTEAGF